LERLKGTVIAEWWMEIVVELNEKDEVEFNYLRLEKFITT
jgi:hypothetical protein